MIQFLPTVKQFQVFLSDKNNCIVINSGINHLLAQRVSSISM